MLISQLCISFISKEDENWKPTYRILESTVRPLHYCTPYTLVSPRQGGDALEVLCIFLLPYWRQKCKTRKLMTYSEFLIEFAQAFHINGCDIYIKKVENIFQPNYVYKKNRWRHFFVCWAYWLKWLWGNICRQG